jgi:CheY-like chemotaxis protein
MGNHSRGSEQVECSNALLSALALVSAVSCAAAVMANEPWRDAFLIGGMLASGAIAIRLSYQQLRGSPAPAAVATVPRTEKATEKAEARVPRVLLAEALASERGTMQRMLEEQGFEVTLARHGRDVLEITHTRRFALIVMACELPELDGFQVTYLLREREKVRGLPRTPVLALTGPTRTVERERALASGFDDCLRRPLRAEDFGARLRRSLAGFEPRAPLPSPQSASTHAGASAHDPAHP